MKYRKKPVVIDAIRNNGTWKPIVEWLQSHGVVFRPGQLPTIIRDESGSSHVPKDFTLTDERLAMAIAEGLPEDQARREFKKFLVHDYKNPHSDWDRVWKKWVLQTVDWLSRRGGGVAPSPSTRRTAGAATRSGSGFWRTRSGCGRRKEDRWEHSYNSN